MGTPFYWRALKAQPVANPAGKRFKHLLDLAGA